MAPLEVIQQLVEALEAAESHLDYCGYGDSYERSAVLEADHPLDEQIADALATGERYIKENPT